MVGKQTVGNVMEGPPAGLAHLRAPPGLEGLASHAATNDASASPHNPVQAEQQQLQRQQDLVAAAYHHGAALAKAVPGGIPPLWSPPWAPGQLGAEYWAHALRVSSMRPTDWLEHSSADPQSTAFLKAQGHTEYPASARGRKGASLRELAAAVALLQASKVVYALEKGAEVLSNDDSMDSESRTDGTVAQPEGLLNWGGASAYPQYAHGILESTSEALPPSAPRFLGIIKAFDPDRGYGFIQSAEIFHAYGCDVFLNRSVEGGCVVGREVSFEVEFSESGQPQARDVRLEVLEDESNFYRHLVGQVFNGKVKSINTGRGFGFLVSRDLSSALSNRDIYFLVTEAPEGRLRVGEEVHFTFSVGRKGQPQAKSIARGSFR